LTAQYFYDIIGGNFSMGRAVAVAKSLKRGSFSTMPNLSICGNMKYTKNKDNYSGSAVHGSTVGRT
jgi:hypothetical protein